MIREIALDPQQSDTRPLWALQPMPKSVSRHATGAFVVARVSKTAVRQPANNERIVARLLIAAIVLFALLNAADLLSTFIGLHNGMREGNPLMSALLHTYGFGALVLYKVIVVVAVALGVRMLRHFRVSVASLTIAICNVLVLLVVIANVTQYAMLS